MSVKDYVGKGTIYLEEVGSSTGLLSIGNCSGLSFAFAEDKQEQKDYQGAGGAIVNTVSRISSIIATVTALDILSPDNLKLAMRGLVTQTAASSVSSEAHAAKLGALVPVDLLPDMSQPVTVTGASATPTYVEGTDYIVETNGVIIIDGGSITADLPIEISYEAVASNTVEAVTQSGKEYKVYFSGLNEADSGKAVSLLIHRTKFSPTTALEMIGESFATLPFTFDVLKDASIVGAGLSQFMQLKSAQ